MTTLGKEGWNTGRTSQPPHHDMQVTVVWRSNSGETIQVWALSQGHTALKENQERVEEVKARGFGADLIRLALSTAGCKWLKK